MKNPEYQYESGRVNTIGNLQGENEGFTLTSRFDNIVCGVQGGFVNGAEGVTLSIVELGATVAPKATVALQIDRETGQTTLFVNADRIVMNGVPMSE